MKNYEEIAYNVFKRRDEYIEKQKLRKKIIINAVIPTACCLILLITGFSLLGNGFFNNSISNNGIHSNQQSSKDITENSNNNVTSDSSIIDENSSQSTPSNEYSSESSVNDIPSTDDPVIPPVTNEDFRIDSIDKINFYSAKKIINENNLLPVSKNSISQIMLLNDYYIEYPIEENRIFTTTMVTYFTITLNDENGFLAQKLGGIGTVEVVVTENDIEPMITFKRENNYYTCLANGANYDPESNKSSQDFSSHKYINGFNIVKNLNQENYKFTVNYEGSKVVGFECSPFKSTSLKYNSDDITFVEDYCVVIFTNQTFTIEQLETYFKNIEEDDLLWKS